MNDFNKYFALMFLIIGGVIGFILAIAILIVILRLLSISMFSIPGTDNIFQYFTIIIPYIIFFAAYFYLRKKIIRSKSKTSGIAAALLVIAGCLLCLITFVL